MAHLPWVDFLRTHPNAHLVAAVIVSSSSGQHLSRLRRLLQQLIAAEQDPVADFATAIVRPTDVAQIYCGFANKVDADRFARIAEAREAEPLAEWQSHRSFELDSAKEMALAGALVPSRNARA